MTSMLKTTSSAPLHAQLTNLLRTDIEAGRLASGDRLPTEKELMREFGISSTTVRQALGALVQEGLIRRRAGQGTFVTEPFVRRDPLTFTGFTEETIANGRRPGGVVISSSFERPTRWITDRLPWDPDDKVFAVERLRLADDLVIAVEQVWFPHAIGLFLVDRDLASASLTSILEDDLNLELVRAFQVISATTATSRVARLLQIARAAPLLEIERTAYLANERPCYVSKGVYRADRYDYRGWIERRKQPGSINQRQPLSRASALLGPDLG